MSESARYWPSLDAQALPLNHRVQLLCNDASSLVGSMISDG